MDAIKTRILAKFAEAGWAACQYQGEDTTKLVMDIPDHRDPALSDGSITINLLRHWWSPGSNTYPSCRESTWFGVSEMGGPDGYTEPEWPERMVADILRANAARLEDLKRLGGF